MKEESKDLLRFVLAFVFAMGVGMTIVYQSSVVPLREELNLAKVLIQAATFMDEGNVERAANYADRVPMRSTRGKEIAPEFLALAKQIYKSFSAHLFQKAKKDFDEGRFARASNDLGVGITYAKFAGVEVPSWVIELRERLRNLGH